MPNDPTEPTQPLTEDTLAGMRRRIDAYTGPDHYRFTIDGIEYDGHWAHDARRLLAEVDRLRAENTALRTEAKQAWSEGHSTALAAGCDNEDQLRANLGVLLRAEEHRCQLVIEREPLNPHWHGHLSGLRRARDIVTGKASALDQSGEGQANG